MFIFLAHMTSPDGSLDRGIHVRFIATFGSAIRCRIERLADGRFYDFNPTARVFSGSPSQPFGPTVERGLGIYAMDLPSLPLSVFPTGDYCISLHDSRIDNQAIGIHLVTLV